MTSPLYDEEAAPSSLEKSKKGAVKMSFFRKWGPALIAIAGVIALNVALLGPSGEKIPELTEKHHRRRQLAMERTAHIEQMEPNHDLDRKLGRRTIGPRDLSEEDGGIMEYTRRRHRHLGEYVHIMKNGFSANHRNTCLLICLLTPPIIGLMARL